MIDLTREFKTARWMPYSTHGNRRRLTPAFYAQFNPGTVAIRWGIYVSLYENPSPLAVHDRNGPGGTTGKVIVRPNGRTLKYGSFENGVVQRHQQNCDHLHRVRPDDTQEPDICCDCLRLFLVLDMTQVFRVDAVKKTETVWKRRIHKWLADGGFDDPTQTGRSESRHLRGPQPTRDEIDLFLTDLEAQTRP